MVAKASGGIAQLFKEIQTHTVPVLQNYGYYTDVHGCFDVSDGQCILALRYRFVEVLGKGHSAVVIKAQDMFDSNKLVAIKILHTQFYQLGYQETDCCQRLRAADPFGVSHICRLLNTCSFDNHYCMVFELMCEPDWAELFLPADRPVRTEEIYSKIRKVAVRLLTVLGFLRQQNVIHADLKPDNLLLKTKGDLSSLHVTDFGNAIHCVYDEVSLYYEDFDLQTLLYRAPEVMFGLEFGQEIDLWSVGCILAELFLGKPLFFGTTKEEVLQQMVHLLGPVPRSLVQRGKFYSSLHMFSFSGTQPDATNDLRSLLETGRIQECRNYAFASFLSQILRYDPGERLSPREAACHPFLAQEIGLAYLIPSATHSGSSDENCGYPSVLVSKKSYSYKPHIDKDILRRHPSSLDLLYMGTSLPGGVPIGGNQRRVAQVPPLGYHTKSPNLSSKVQDGPTDSRSCDTSPQVLDGPTESRSGETSLQVMGGPSGSSETSPQVLSCSTDSRSGETSPIVQDDLLSAEGRQCPVKLNGRQNQARPAKKVRRQKRMKFSRKKTFLQVKAQSGCSAEHIYEPEQVSVYLTGKTGRSRKIVGENMQSDRKQLSEHPGNTARKWPLHNYSEDHPGNTKKSAHDYLGEHPGNTTKEQQFHDHKAEPPSNITRKQPIHHQPGLVSSPVTLQPLQCPPVTTNSELVLGLSNSGSSSSDSQPSPLKTSLKHSFTVQRISGQKRKHSEKSTPCKSGGKLLTSAPHKSTNQQGVKRVCHKIKTRSSNCHVKQETVQNPGELHKMTWKLETVKQSLNTANSVKPTSRDSSAEKYSETLNKKWFNLEGTAVSNPEQGDAQYEHGLLAHIDKGLPSESQRSGKSSCDKHSGVPLQKRVKRLKFMQRSKALQRSAVGSNGAKGRGQIHAEMDADAGSSSPLSDGCDEEVLLVKY